MSLPPDCLEAIFEVLAKDCRSLYSCLLVNRAWCETAIRMLWQDPFQLLYEWSGVTYELIAPPRRRYFPITRPTGAQERTLRAIARRAARVVDTYVRCLPLDAKRRLEAHDVMPSDQSACLFEYARYLRNLDYARLHHWIAWWLRDADGSDNNREAIDEFKEFQVARELCKMVFAQASVLRRLCLHDYHECDRVKNAIALTALPGAPECLAKVQHCVCDQHVPSSVLYELAEQCRDLTRLDVHSGGAMPNALVYLIKVQRRLEHFSFFDTLIDDWPVNNSIIYTLRNHSSLLKHIELHYLFDDPQVLDVIASCQNLETLVMIFHPDTPEAPLGALASASFRNLARLEIRGVIDQDIPQIAKIIENTNGSLSKLFLDCDSNMTWDGSQPISSAGLTLVNAVIRSCPNLVHLHIAISVNSIPLISRLLESCRNLRRLALSFWTEIQDSSNILDDIARLLPRLVHLEFKNLGQHALIPRSLESFLTAKRQSCKTFEMILPGDLSDDKIEVLKRFGRVSAESEEHRVGFVMELA